MPVRAKGTEQSMTAWRNTEPAAGPGAPRVYSDRAIDSAHLHVCLSSQLARGAGLPVLSSGAVEPARLVEPQPCMRGLKHTGGKTEEGVQTDTG
jgi:hypothetical protein